MHSCGLSTGRKERQARQIQTFGSRKREMQASPRTACCQHLRPRQCLNNFEQKITDGADSQKKLAASTRLPTISLALAVQRMYRQMNMVRWARWVSRTGQAPDP
eukprot:4627680-Pleurochrysis_carterae.AAC.2